jgi:hypothetical protein
MHLRPRALVSFLSALVAFAPCALAAPRSQGTRAAPPGPGPRAGHCLVYDEEAKRVLLLSGDQPPDPPAFDEVWAFDGAHWEKRPGTGPVARSLSAAAWDARARRVVLHGGVGNAGYDELLGDAWAWKGSGWSMLPDTGVGTRDHHWMVCDEKRGVLVLYGGQTSTRAMETRTWTFDGARWSGADVPGPGARVHFAMAYDSRRARVVLFGGYSDGVEKGDTWEWDGASWSLVASGGPSSRGAHRMAYDAAAEVVVLHGGDGRRGQRDDTWVWDGSTWTDTEATGTGGRSLHAMAYDRARGRIVLHGGNRGHALLADTWEWDGASWTPVP